MTKYLNSNGILIQSSGLLLFLLIMLLSACQSIVPATVPPQLSHTPGASIIVTENQIDAGWFTLEYPDGWRIVTNIAIDPLRLTLVSPDDEMIIYIADDACLIPDTTPEPGTYRLDSCPDNENRNLHIFGSPELAIQDIYAPIFDAVVESVQFP